MKQLFFLIIFLLAGCLHGQGLIPNEVYYDIEYKKKQPQFTDASYSGPAEVAPEDTIFINWNAVTEKDSSDGSQYSYDTSGGWIVIPSATKWQPQTTNNTVSFESTITFQEEGVYTFRIWAWRFMASNETDKWIKSLAPSPEVGVDVDFPDDTTPPAVVTHPIIIKQ